MKKGIIKISKEIYDQYWFVVADMFKEFKPYHIEFSVWDNDIWRFHGTSERFDELKEGDLIPFYEVIFDRENKTYTFQKVS